MEEREKITYEHDDSIKVNYLIYGDRKVLVESQFVADMGFSGNVKTPIGFLVGKPEQVDKKSGKSISVLETLFENEKEEIREILNSCD
jgi:hypothetical protein